MKSRRACYGYYGLPKLSVVIALTLLVGVLLLYFASRLFGWIVIGFGFYVLLSYGVSITLLQRKREEDFPGILRLEGDEHVLDVGCGLGRMTIVVAKKLKEGKVVGIDIWDRKELWSNSPERAYANAELEGVRERVEFRYGSVLEIPFPDGTFDSVTCSSVLNNLSGRTPKSKALSEIYRVLKGGGKLLLLEPLRTLRMFFLFTPFAFWQLLNKDAWTRLLSKAGFVNLEFYYQDGVGLFLAEKPSKARAS